MIHPVWVTLESSKLVPCLPPPSWWWAWCVWSVSRWCHVYQGSPFLHRSWQRLHCPAHNSTLGIAPNLSKHVLGPPLLGSIYRRFCRVVPLASPDTSRTLCNATMIMQTVHTRRDAHTFQAYVHLLWAIATVPQIMPSFCPAGESQMARLSA